VYPSIASRGIQETDVTDDSTCIAASFDDQPSLSIADGKRWNHNGILTMTGAGVT
jgi:hypothetical protein